MKIEYLNYILEVWRCGSINAAAKVLYLSQSGLSSIIKSVEGELGYPIFERGQNGIVASPQGARFFRYAERMVSDYEAMLEIGRQVREEENLSIVSSRFSYAMHCFYDFIRSRPKGVYRDTFQEFGINRVIDSIATNKGRIGVLVVQQNQLDRFRRMAKERDLDLYVTDIELDVSILMSQSHPLAKLDVVPFDELKKYKFVADIDVSDEDLLLEDTRTGLRLSDRASTYDAIHLEGFISTILSVDEPDAIRHNCICRPLTGHASRFVMIYFKRKNMDFHSRELGYLTYLSEKICQQG